MSAACTRWLSPDSPCSSILSEWYRPARSSVSLSSACLSCGGNIAVRLFISSCWESVSSSSGSSSTRTSISFHSSLPSGDSFAASPSNNSTNSFLLTASLRTPGHQGGAILYLVSSQVSYPLVNSNLLQSLGEGFRKPPRWDRLWCNRLAFTRCSPPSL